MDALGTNSISQVEVSVPCTCGELFQGTVDGLPCLVSCPIAHHSVGRYASSPSARWQVRGAGRKVRDALRRLSHAHPACQGGLVTITASLPPGRGYGTSTADIGAALSAASQACGAPLSPVQLSRIAVMVEPTDSTLFPGLTLFDHRSGDFYETLGPAPQAVVVVLDPGGEVDTEAFNHLDHTPVLRSLATEHRQAFDLLRDAIGRADLVALGEACTLDARLHQRVLPNPLLDAACCVAAETGAVGVCRAHSGTLLGLLFHPAQFDPGRLRRSVSSRIPASVALSVTRLSGGGAQVHGLPVEYPKADVRCP